MTDYIDTPITVEECIRTDRQAAVARDAMGLHHLAAKARRRSEAMQVLLDIGCRADAVEIAATFGVTCY